MALDHPPSDPIMAPPRLLAVRGAPNILVQALFRELALIWRTAGLRVAGVVEDVFYAPDSGEPTRWLRDLATGVRYPVTQTLGPGSSACRIDGSGFASACVAIERAVRRGCDLAIISKFGKLEAERGGLADAFRITLDAGIPTVTAVPAYAEEAWLAFADAYTAFVGADREAVESWRIEVARADAQRRIDPPAQRVCARAFRMI